MSDSVIYIESAKRGDVIVLGAEARRVLGIKVDPGVAPRVTIYTESVRTQAKKTFRRKKGDTVVLRKP